MATLSRHTEMSTPRHCQPYRKNQTHWRLSWQQHVQTTHVNKQAYAIHPCHPTDIACRRLSEIRLADYLQSGQNSNLFIHVANRYDFQGRKSILVVCDSCYISQSKKSAIWYSDIQRIDYWSCCIGGSRRTLNSCRSTCISCNSNGMQAPLSHTTTGKTQSC